MVYNEKLVAVVMCNGQILREIRNPGSDDVRLPFGSEYSIRFKNLNSTRAAISVSIDGEDVLDGHRLVVDANETTDLEGFMKGSSVRNKFRFIQKTDEISDHRGDKIDDGLLRIEYQFEKPPTQYAPRYDKFWLHDTIGGSWGNEIYYKDGLPPIGSGNVLRSRETRTCGGDIRMQSSNFDRGMDQAKSLIDNNAFDNSFENQVDEGITVKGSQMNQHYNRTYLGQMEEQTHVIIFNLKGSTGKEKKIVKKPVTVKTKITCETCGRKYNARTKFCPNCGTCLS